MPADLERVALPSRARNPLLRFLSSIWLGVALLALILVYSSVISALPPVRWTLEMTEMQAFRHWLFVAPVGLFVVALLTATLFRTRWIPINIGALTAHVGLLLLVGGALVYFAAKVEGNELLQAPEIQVRTNAGGTPMVIDRFRAGAGETWSRALPRLAGPLRITVLTTEPAGLQPVAAATVQVQVGDAAPQTYRLAAGSQAWQPITESLAVGLVTFPPQRSFYDDERPALYINNRGATGEVIAEIQHLPIYHEHYPRGDGLLHDSLGGEVPPVRERPELRLLGLTIPTGWFEPWRMPIDVATPGLPFTVQITGYAPYVLDLRPVLDPNGAVTQEPVLATREERRLDISARSMSAIRLKFTGRGDKSAWSETRWCPFSLYPDVDVRPIQVALPGSDAPWEIIYSRVRHDLGATLATGRLDVEYFPGRRGIKGYRSEVMIQPPAGSPYPATVQTNRTATVGPWTLFQSGFAEDHWSYSILGVGNRVGMLPMDIGWIVVTLGCLYAFYVKPVLLRRARRLASGLAPVLAAAVLLCLPGCRKAEPYPASEAAARLDRQSTWSDARLIAVQEGGRYKTLDSFARESFSDITGSEHLPGLSPLASLFEWLFNRDAYADTPVIKVRSPNVRARLAAALSAEKRTRIEAYPYFTPREIFSPEIERLLTEMESWPMMRSAVNRVRNAQGLAERLDEFLAIVPQPGGDAVATWSTPEQILANLSDEQLQQMGITRADLPMHARQPVPGLTAEQAFRVIPAWYSLRAAWLHGDAGGVQHYVDRLAELLPSFAADHIYPARTQLQAEARYYAAGKFMYGWGLYFLALLISIVALVTGWRTPWLLTILIMVAGLTVHVYGISLRWYILGRIPVANMFEAVVASAAAGIAIALLVELFQKTRVLLVGGAATGFLALVGAQYVLPGSALGIIPSILDDIQLRLHTVLIITAYALIFVAAVIAVIYLIGYYAARLGHRGSAEPAGRRSAGDGRLAAASAVSPQRPLLAGATPGDEGAGAGLPAWLNNIDWSHLIVLNMVFVLLFVGGIVLGAWWADYSWGRQWGWAPKEVFALNNCIIYEILIHLRFVVRTRGLWTAWLSIAGCIMMAFNWFFVNFFIASVHSYA